LVIWSHQQRDLLSRLARNKSIVDGCAVAIWSWPVNNPNFLHSLRVQMRDCNGTRATGSAPK